MSKRCANCAHHTGPDGDCDQIQKAFPWNPGLYSTVDDFYCMYWDPDWVEEAMQQHAGECDIPPDFTANVPADNEWMIQEAARLAGVLVYTVSIRPDMIGIYTMEGERDLTCFWAIYRELKEEQEEA